LLRLSPKFLTLIGAELEQVEYGKVVISCRQKDSLTQQQGLIHGGVVTALADVSCGYAALTTMPDDAEDRVIVTLPRYGRANSAKMAWLRAKLRLAAVPFTAIFKGSGC
jgi:acyl-coenzyme A thioesterase PaaI-like protein